MDKFLKMFTIYVIEPLIRIVKANIEGLSSNRKILVLNFEEAYALINQLKQLLNQ